MVIFPTSFPSSTCRKTYFFLPRYFQLQWIDFRFPLTAVFFCSWARSSNLGRDALKLLVHVLIWLIWWLKTLLLMSAFNSSLNEAVTFSMICLVLVSSTSGRYGCNRLQTRSHCSFFLLCSLNSRDRSRLALPLWHTCNYLTWLLKSYINELH